MRAPIRRSSASAASSCWQMVTAWRCELGDDLPNGRAIAMEWMRPHTYAAAVESFTSRVEPNTRARIT